MNLNFRKCKTPENVKKVFEDNKDETPTPKQLQNAFDKISSGEVNMKPIVKALRKRFEGDALVSGDEQ